MNRLRGTAALAFLLPLALAAGCGAFGGSENTASPEDGGSEGSTSPDGSTTVDPDGGAAADADASKPCAYDCRGGACLDGVCQPVVVLGGLERPYAIAADGDGVYFTDLGPQGTTNAGSLNACEGSGPCTAVVIKGALASPKAVAINANDVVVSQWSAAQASPVNQAVQSFVRATHSDSLGFPFGAFTARGLAADDTYIWIADNGVAGGNGTITRQVRSGTTYNFDQYVVPTSMNVRPELVTVMKNGANRREFYTANDALFEKGVGSNNLASGHAFVDLVNDGTGVYWINEKNQPNRIWGCPTGAGASCADLLNAPAPTASGLVADATGLYWVEEGTNARSGRLRFLPKGASTAQVLLDGLDRPQKLAIVANKIYITVFGAAGGQNGALLRVAKP